MFFSFFLNETKRQAAFLGKTQYLNIFEPLLLLPTRKLDGRILVPPLLTSAVLSLSIPIKEMVVLFVILFGSDFVGKAA